MYKHFFWIGTLIIGLLAMIYKTTYPNNFDTRTEAFRIETIKKIYQNGNGPSVTTAAPPKSKSDLTDFDKRFISMTDDEKRINSAKIFANYYLLNTKERQKYCLSQGINIESFVTSFKQEHSDLLLRTKSIRKDFDEDALYSKMHSTYERLILENFSALETQYQTDAKGVCWLYLKNSEIVAKNMHFSKAFPLPYQALIR